MRNHNLALVFLPASDIPRFVGQGNVDLGITGKDMVAEASAEKFSFTSTYTSTRMNNCPTATDGEFSENGVRLADLIQEILPLGFGLCKLQVQVPERSQNLKCVKDLVGRKIATSFDGLASELFVRLDAEVNAARGLVGDQALKTKIDYIGGSVEAACALGVADGIVDLVGASRCLA